MSAYVIAEIEITDPDGRMVLVEGT